MTQPPNDPRSEAEAARVEREMELIRRHRARTPAHQPVRRLALTVITTALIVFALWLAMR
jgi:hypothetical protein